ncbi:23S rRNA (adenine(2030)-N(6))-methyltransferase RlmJ [Salinicola rhizosphaerae]|uniref:Ribosomal RNA large subunit methyltransferase J n=1 Tax=Salinicola rhizosphaerae TaxID=1443141 RepID=A0ABQ3DUY0_9GAMM|nr:23S rRNA (adenine(2030)-N(6))-methyltransferase RlmJ [Salinicola rhizosphaerae]GHB14127.1 ribosomal RNA large subunit methyltransferase J [Salinicola rhizosphaerae]
MLAYQHAYHAGNFADVHKHLGLSCLVEALMRKPSAISFVDTHAGRGVYPLDAPETQKLGEFHQGVARLWERRSRLEPDSALAAWVARLATLQKSDRLSRYPGSPWWIGASLREQDRLTLFELHPGEHRHLADQTLPADGRIQRRHADGLEGLARLVPVSTPRLCVLIDPSYERKAEYEEVVKTLKQVAHKVRHAVVVIWYPLLPAGRHLSMLDALRDAGIPKLWRSELKIREPDATHGMYGSGLLVLNPPWQLDQTLDSTFSTLAPMLAANASHQSEWWTGET